MAYLGSNETLAAGATYVSETKRTDWYDHIQGTANASQDGTLYVEQSYDPKAETDPANAVWDYSNAIAVTSSGSATTTANSGTTDKGVVFDESIYGPFWRLRFKATSGSGTTSIRIHAKCTTEGDF